MKRSILSLLLLAALVGCAARSMTPQEKVVVANETYKDEHLACVAAAATLAESSACRAGVRQDWHVDGGAR